MFGFFFGKTHTFQSLYVAKHCMYRMLYPSSQSQSFNFKICQHCGCDSLKLEANYHCYLQCLDTPCPYLVLISNRNNSFLYIACVGMLTIYCELLGTGKVNSDNNCPTAQQVQICSLPLHRSLHSSCLRFVMRRQEPVLPQPERAFGSTLSPSVPTTCTLYWPCLQWAIHSEPGVGTSQVGYALHQQC